MRLTAFLTNGLGGPDLSERFVNFAQSGNGWDFEARGLLVRLITTFDPTVVNSGNFGAPFDVQCHTVARYVYLGPNGTTIYFQNRGQEQSCDFKVANTQDRTICLGQVSAIGSGAACQFGPTELWSTDRQISLSIQNNDANAILRYPNGDVEVMNLSNGGVTHPQSAAVLAFNEPRSTTTKQSWATTQRIDRNGNITRYSSDPGTGRLLKITDPQGRETTYTYDTSGDLISITAPGPSGTTMTWSLTWNAFTWNPRALFPDVDCVDSPPPNGFPVHGNHICTNALTYRTLTSMTIPDGRSYTFSYTFPADYKFGAQNGWGNVTQMTTPDGGVTKYDYGDDSTTFFRPTGLAFLQCPAGLGSGFNMDAIYRRRVDAVTIQPQGLSGPSHRTTIKNNNIATLLSQQTPGKCYQLQWVKTTLPDGHIRKEATCDEGGWGTGYGSLNGRKFAREEWDSTNTTLLEATYFGNPGGIGDTETSIGSMYMDSEYASSGNSNGFFLDVRPYKVIHFKDGIKWTERFFYETSNIPAGTSTTCTGPCQAFRTWGNVTSNRIEDANGDTLSNIVTSYFHTAPYLNRNLLRLPESIKLKSGGAVLTRTEYFYDEAAFPLTSSGAPNLDTTYTTAARGNVTTVKSYADAENALKPISSHALYFDTGTIRESRDPKGNSVFTSYDFGLCSSIHTMLTSTVTNALGHITTTVSDCNLNLPLRMTDPNGNSSFSQYDTLGRLVETAGPGDTLTPITGFTRDPGAPLNGGSVVGNNGQGPTTWREYRSLGVINQQHTVVHTKDGTTNGHYIKTFVDGLGRTIQTRTEVDPLTTGGNAENVVTTEYDNMGRVSKTFVPCFLSASNSVTAHCTPLATTTSYDALGRVISVTPPGLPATTTSYQGSGTEWVSTVTDANGNLAKIFTDALGRTVKSSRRWVEGGGKGCSDSVLGSLWCSTIMRYDGAGRMLSTTDPGGNVMSFIYDGLGRKTEMTDPDMGRWTYEYDDNGNLFKQTDAKNQVVKMFYDNLNRITLRDLVPVDVAGEEDETYFYDGNQPSTCYSCDDHCATTTDTCDAATGTCVHVGTPCDGGPPTGTPPAAPGNLSATTISSSQINLSWTDNSNNETGFKIERSVDGGATFTLLTTVSANVTAFPNTGLTPNTTYHYRVKATNGVGDSAASNVASATTSATATPPNAPSGLSAVTISSTQINLSWTDNSNNETGFKIERSVDGGATFSLLATVGANITSFPNTGLTPNTTYHYRVKATNGSGDSAASNVASATTSGTAPNAPSNLVASAISSTQINLSWTDNSNNETGFKIERSTNGGATFSLLTTVGANITSFQNTGLTPNTTYHYRVKATNGNGDSAASNVAAATTPPQCSFGINPNFANVTAGGATGNTVSVSANCPWTAVSNVSWIQITAGSSGSSNGTVTYNVLANNTGSPRNGTMTIAGLTFTVSQESCSFFIQPTNESVSYTSTQNTVFVSAPGGCPWTAVSNVPWLTINSGASGSGSGSVVYTVATNTSTTWPVNRTGTMTIAGQTFTVTQAGQPSCPNSAGLSCDSIGLQSCTKKCFLSGGGTATVYVWLSRTDCDWLPRTTDPWIHITNVNDPGTNPRTITYSVDPNTAPLARIGNIMINGLTHTVTQGGSSSTASGRVTTSTGQGLAGVTITFSALVSYPGLPAPVVTDANGNWTQSGFVACKSNIATPSKSGYTFTPVKRGFTPGAVGMDFVATPTQSLKVDLPNELREPPGVLMSLASMEDSKPADKQAAPGEARALESQVLSAHYSTEFGLLSGLALLFAVSVYRNRSWPKKKKRTR